MKKAVHSQYDIIIDDRFSINMEAIMEKQLIFFDIDGTLLDDDKKLPKSTKYAVQRLKELGHEVAIATGRSPHMFRELREELEIDTYVSLNGQYVVHKETPVFTNPLDQDELYRLISTSEKLNSPLIFQDHEGLNANVHSHDYVNVSMNSLKIKDVPLYEPEFYKHHPVYQTLLFCTEEEEKANYQGQYQKFDMIRWHEFAVDILPAGGTKANGIKELVKHLGKSMDNIYAFGDGLNDVEMLKFVKNSVAMGNAHEEAKKVAKHVTTSVHENGILNGLEMVGLL